MDRALVIGSRGSKLALWQAEMIQSVLLASTPDLKVRIEIIKTTGDVKPDPLSVIGGKGVFTKELEDALLDQRIDVAVHSLKDLPTILPPGLTISAIGKREQPNDALVLSAPGKIESLRNLPQDAVVGTSSQRRMAQLKALRQDVNVKDLRGNVDTRLRKLDEGQYDALILAAAGLRRLGLQDRINLAIDPAEILPAVGQGAIAIESREDDERTRDLVAVVNHLPTSIECRAERAFLRSLGGGCQLPIAAHAINDGAALKLEGLVAKPDGSQIVRGDLTGPMDLPEQLGEQLAQQLIQNGAQTILSGT